MRRRCGGRAGAAPGASRGGSALPLLLLALSLGALLLLAAQPALREGWRTAGGELAALRARASADGAVATVVQRWPGRWSLALPVGGVDSQAVSSPAGRATVRVVRLDSLRFLLAVEARDGDAGGAERGAVRRVQALARRSPPPPGAGAALVAGGAVRLAAGARLEGGSATPDGWPGCTGAPPARAASVAEAGRLVADAGSVVVGAVATDGPAADAAAHDALAALLAARATVVVAAGGVHAPVPRPADGGCVADAGSWGEPRRGVGAVAGCVASAPVVHVRGAGTTVLRGPSRFQGTLVVDGTLLVEGTVQGAGTVLVGGALRAEGGALALDGELRVRGAGGGESVLGSGSRVRASPCAAARAAAAAAPVRPASRRWRAEIVR